MRSLTVFGTSGTQILKCTLIIRNTAMPLTTATETTMPDRAAGLRFALRVWDRGKKENRKSKYMGR